MHRIAFTLIVIGGLNWGILAVTGWEIGQIFGGMDAVISKIIYIVIGLAALLEAFTHKHNCRKCAEGAKPTAPPTPTPTPEA